MSDFETRMKRFKKIRRNHLAKELRANPLYKQKIINSPIVKSLQKKKFSYDHYVKDTEND